MLPSLHFIVILGSTCFQSSTIVNIHEWVKPLCCKKHFAELEDARWLEFALLCRFPRLTRCVSWEEILMPKHSAELWGMQLKIFSSDFISFAKTFRWVGTVVGSWFTASKLARGDFFSKLRVSLVLAEMVSSLGSTLWWGVQGPQKKVEILKIKISFLFSSAASNLEQTHVLFASFYPLYSYLEPIF